MPISVMCLLIKTFNYTVLFTKQQFIIQIHTKIIQNIITKEKLTFENCVCDEELLSVSM